jgi:hypothetical protein
MSLVRKNFSRVAELRNIGEYLNKVRFKCNNKINKYDWKWKERIILVAIA